MEGASERTLHLPEGEWVDLLTGERREGARAITRAVPIDEVAAHLRAGALVPMLPPEVVSLVPTPGDEIIAWEDARWTRVRVVPGEAGSLRHFDGLRASMEPLAADGSLALEVALEAPDSDLDPRIAHSPEAVVLEIERRGTSLDASVGEVTLTRAGEPVELEARPSDADPRAPAEGHWVGDDGRLLYVRLEAGGALVVRP